MNRKSAFDAEIDRLTRAYAAFNEQLATQQREAMSGEGWFTRSVVDALIEKVGVYPGKRIEVEWKIAGICGE